MKNIFLIHGSFGNPFENWSPWFSKKIETNNTKVFAPHFPTPQYAKLG